MVFPRVSGPAESRPLRVLFLEVAISGPDSSFVTDETAFVLRAKDVIWREPLL